MFFLSDNPGSTEYTLLACALSGTLFFVLRVLMTLILGVGAEDFDVGDSVDVDGAHSDSAFKLLSITNISAFFMMFGWSGLTAIVEFQLAPVIGLLIATIVGLIAMSLSAWTLALAAKLTSAGQEFDLSELIGEMATVYQRIPEKGRGRINITVNGMLREIDAESRESVVIESFSNVKIVALTAGGAVVVEEISS